ncbi:MAG: cytochrome c oxidase subunit 3 [Myxococcaceae bacterium]|nr:cytochrome c oxidase subunit 3 [Myxococcaceae bacterium]
MTMKARALDDPPGGVLLWLIVGLELVTFAIVFALVAGVRRAQPDEFAAGQGALSPALGLTLTLLLITSGALAAQGVHRLRQTRLDDTRRWLLAAAGVGAAFLVVKAVDCSAHLGAGHRLGSSDFWDAYLLATGFHFVHVVVGVALLLFVSLRRAVFDDVETAYAGAALFWHLCDVVWFFLFPLFFVRA